MESTKLTCWVCKSTDMALVRPSGIKGHLNSESFAITDSNYGVTGELYACNKCGFIQCSELDDVTSFYEKLQDEQYESGRKERSAQARKLMELLRPYRRDGRLLDVGAGSGILVEQASAMGYTAEGVEPSRWLHQQASKYGLKVHLGVFPHPDVKDDFDLVTIVDVIEHVSNPVPLLTSIALQMRDDGFGLVVTPDKDALIPRAMGWKWWHFRIAHIGYFNRSNLLLALDRAGLEPVKIGRPTWYFGAGYLLERGLQYLPRFLRFSVPESFNRLAIPLNLGDSLYVVFRKKTGRK